MMTMRLPEELRRGRPLTDRQAETASMDWKTGCVRSTLVDAGPLIALFDRETQRVNCRPNAIVISYRG